MKTHKNQRGSALIWVLCIFMFLFLTSVALLTASVSANLVAAKQVSGQQAYFTARSAAAATAQSIIKKPILASQLLNSAFVPNQDTQKKVGDFDVTVKMQNTDPNIIKVVATGYYPNRTGPQSEKSTVVAYLKNQNVTDSVFYLLDNLIFGQNNLEIDGNITVNGRLSGGNLTVDGNTYTFKGTDIKQYKDPSTESDSTINQFNFDNFPKVTPPVYSYDAVIKNNIISESGNFPNNFFGQVVTSPDNDINLVVKDGSSITVDHDIHVSGGGNLIIWLKGNSTLSLDGKKGDGIAISPNDANSHIYIIGDNSNPTYAQTLQVYKVNLTAFVYMTQGTFDLQKMALDKNITGWIIAESATIGNLGSGNGKIQYQKSPDKSPINGLNSIFANSYSSIGRWSNK